uniref:Poly [ADP-ribose] polymerase n=1 Tax=Scleropages formosus TaxID=113540 RepID=A0A8C9SP92_SCLFO
MAADGFPFPLWVLGDWGSGAPKLVNKLTIYFQSKRSQGGDCLVEAGGGGDAQRAVVRFKSEHVRQRVLNKQEHELKLGQKILKLTVRLPQPEDEANLGNVSTLPEVFVMYSTNIDVLKQFIFENASSQSASEVAGLEEEEQMTSVVLESIQEKMNQHFLEILVENISDCSAESEDFIIEIIPDISTAVVSFRNSKDAQEFIKNCPSNKMFRQNGLAVKLLENTTEVRVENIPPGVDSDYLHLYFDREGDVNKVTKVDEQCAIVSFMNPKVVDKIIKKQYRIQERPLKVYPHYQSLGTALYGKNRPVWKLPKPFTENIDSAIWKFLHDKEMTEAVKQDMVNHFCTVDLQSPIVEISPIPSLLKQKGLMSRHIDGWRENASSAFHSALSKFTSFKCQVHTPLWNATEPEIRSALMDVVTVMPDMNKEEITLAGLKEDVERFQKVLAEILNAAADKLERERNRITQEMSVAPSNYHILQLDGLELEKIKASYPDLKLSYNQESKRIILSGLASEVFSIKSKILEMIMNMKRRLVELDKDVLHFFSEGDLEELSYYLFISQGINAKLESDGIRVQIVSNTDHVLEKAEKHLRAVLVSLYIDVEDLNVLRMAEWQDLVSSLIKTTMNPIQTVTVRVIGTDPNLQVAVTGFQDQLQIVWKQLSDFLYKNTIIDETLNVKERVIVQFIREYKKKIWSATLKDFVQVNFNDQTRNPSISLTGPRLYVTESKEVFEDLLSSIYFDVFKVVQPGARKFFKEKEDMYVTTAMSQMGCMVELVDESITLVEEETVSQVKMPDGVVITVCKADIGQYPADVVVNALNEDVQHTGGLTGVSLAASGPHLQEMFENYSHTAGKTPGDVIITPGDLRFKHMIYAIGPRFEDTDPQRAVGILKRIVKQSLSLAAKYGCQSIAIPAFTSESFGFPLSLCTETVAIAVKEHCEDLYGENTLRKIHLVNSDSQTVHALELAVKKVFGNPRVQQRNPLVQFEVDEKSHDAAPTAGINMVQTKEGLTISLMKGYIQNALTKVTVNTLAEDLSLDCGSVSKAILTAAGAQLQNLVSQQAASGNPGKGSVLVTKGCNLKSELVFHAIAPKWDKGKGMAEKMLRGIMQKCLEQAEQLNQTSIAFSAIGTGNLGFPKNLVASLMLEEVLQFSRKRTPQQLQEVVFILYPGDMQTIQAFTDEFGKQFHSHSKQPGDMTAEANPTVSAGAVKSPKPGEYEMRTGSVLLQVFTGDITKETTDCIVNSSNSDFSLKSGVSKAILSAGGHAVEAECRQLASQTNNKMIMTQAGGLKSKKIIHIVGQTDPVQIRECVTAVLQMCSKNNLTSVSFPALGTGQGGVNPAQVADAMVGAVVDAGGMKSSSSVQVVRIVIFQAHMLNEFYNSMIKMEPTPIQPQPTFWARSSKLFAFNLVHRQKPKVPVRKAKKMDPALFHVCGDSHDTVEVTKKWIEDLIVKEQHFMTITDDAILQFSSEEHQKIEELERNLQVKVTLDIKDPEGSLTVEGISSDVLKAISHIQDLLKRIRTETNQKRDASLLSNLVEWQYQLGSQYVPFDSLANLQLEQAAESSQRDIKVTTNGQDFKVTLPDGPAVDKTGNKFEIRRINKLEATGQDSIPQHWSAMPAKTLCATVSLQTGTAEYNEVLGLFKATCRNNVLKIERVQNLCLWKNFQILKENFNNKNGHTNNERRLFHGTSQATIEHINNHGFNRSYAGKNAAAFGNGTYFAVAASYSASSTYAVPDAQGHKHVYLCRVLTGDFTNGRQGLLVPPQKNHRTQLYDSVTDNINNPSMFVIFNDIQAYPEYLITFH